MYIGTVNNSEKRCERTIAYYLRRNYIYEEAMNQRPSLTMNDSANDSDNDSDNVQ